MTEPRHSDDPIHAITESVIAGRGWANVHIDTGDGDWRGPTLDEVEEALTCAVARLRLALIECATASGADVSDGPPGWPPVDEWAVQEVKQMRADYEADG